MRKEGGEGRSKRERGREERKEGGGDRMREGVRVKGNEGRKG